MTFLAFMKEFHSKWLPKGWESDVHCKLLGTKQAGPFWEWVVKVQAWNALLCGTTYHLNDAQLLNQLEANLEPVLSNVLIEEEVKECDLDLWLMTVKNLDDKKCCKCQQQCADAERAHLKHTGASVGLAEPLHHYNCRLITMSTGTAMMTTRLPKMTKN
jgi:hypothetical protein